MAASLFESISIVAIPGVIGSGWLFVRLRKIRLRQGKSGRQLRTGDSGIENRVRAYFADHGWTLHFSELCSFTASKHPFEVHVLAGLHVRGLHERPSPRVAKEKIFNIKAAHAKKDPTVLVVTADADSSEFYRNVADGKAEILENTNLDYLDYLDFSKLVNAPGNAASTWALGAISKTAALCRHLSNAQKAAGNAEAALSWAARAAELDPGDAASHHHLSGLQLDANDLDGAERSANRAFALEPRKAVHIQRLSLLALKRGDVEQSLRLAQEAVATGQALAGSYHHLAYLYMRKRDYAAAEAAQQQAVLLGRGEALYTKRLDEIRSFM